VIIRDELQRQAAQADIRVELQERDYVLGWFLLGLAQTPDLLQVMVFKGGTALRKTYFPAYRFSEDLDFTVIEPMKEQNLKAKVEAVCRYVEGSSGVWMSIALWRQTRDVTNEEAYRVRLAYVGPLGQIGTEPSRITLDLTHYERLVLPAEQRPIVHPYSDAPAERRCVPTYALEEMLAEKLRALLRRCYPQDLYDVWALFKQHGERLNRQLLLQTLEEKCRHKGYAFSSAHDFLLRAEREGMSAAWDRSLQHLISRHPSHQVVVADLRTLLPEWLER
jgi:predicted nucleotidyltransferase component of viral defense system